MSAVPSNTTDDRHSAISPHPLRVVGLAGLALGLSLAGDASLYAILPSRPELAGVGVGAVGLLLSVNRLVRLVLNPLSGLLHDRIGRRRPYLLALALGALSTALYGSVQGLVPWLIARALWGASWALILVGAYSMLMDVASPRNRGLLSGMIQTSYFLGAATGMVGACLSDAASFPLAMWVCAGITSVGLLATLAIPETHGREDRVVTPRANTANRGSWRSLAVVNALYALGFFCANGVFYSTLGRFVRNGWGATVRVGAQRLGVASLTGGLLMARSLLGLFAGPVGGRLSDRLGRWPVVAACAFLSGFGFLGMASGRTVPALIGGAALLTGVPAMIAILAALIGDRSDARRYGLSFGGLATCGDTGAAAGPLVAYFLVARGVDLSAVYTGCATLLLLGAAAAVVMARRGR